MVVWMETFLGRSLEKQWEKSPFKAPCESQQWQHWAELTDLILCIWNWREAFSQVGGKSPPVSQGSGTKLFPSIRTKWYCSDRIKHKFWETLLFSAYQSTTAYHCENITHYKVSWDTSQSVKSILRYFSTIFSGTCSEHSRCGKRLQNSAWALKSSAGCLPVIALKRAQREKEKRKWVRTVFSQVLGHWQARVGLLVYFFIGCMQWGRLWNGFATLFQLY